MIHPDTEIRYLDDQIGWGVIAVRSIPRGTITWVRDDLDQTFAPAAVEAMAPQYRAIIDKYTFIDGRGRYVLCWDHARFMNHSCRPTCLSPGFDFEIAIRDVQPGEQLTDDYGTLNSENAFVCCCGEPGCRRTIRPTDLLAHADQWDRLLESVFPRIGDVAQPLWTVLKEKREVERVLRGEVAMPSCRLNYNPLVVANAAVPKVA